MNIHSLFWKIFLSFWVFMVLFGICSVLISTQLRQTATRSTHIPVPKIIRRIHKLIMQDSSHEELRESLIEMQNRIQADVVYILDSKNKDLLNRQLSATLQQALQKNEASPLKFSPLFQKPVPFPEPPPMHLREIPPSPGPAIIIKKLQTASGANYTLLIDNRTSRDNWFFWRSLSIGARIAIASLLSGIICFFLARYLTAPLLKLRTATHRIASGHFNDPMDTRIAERKDEIGDLGRDFESMAKRIDITLQSQQRLLRDVSHELRSPLARLQIALGLAHQRSNGLVEPELQRIEQEVERLNELVSKSLSLARLSSLMSIPEKTKINLVELLTDVIINTEYEAQNKQCQIELTAMENCYIEGNWDLLHSAIENILRNAIHYTKTGTHIETSISQSFNTSVSVAKISIRDYGRGVPEADLNELFKPFFRVDEARTQQSGGHGIGLAIAERAIHLHNGTISVANASGGGLEFTLQIPLV